MCTHVRIIFYIVLNGNNVLTRRGKPTERYIISTHDLIEVNPSRVLSHLNNRPQIHIYKNTKQIWISLKECAQLMTVKRYWDGNTINNYFVSALDVLLNFYISNKNFTTNAVFEFSIHSYDQIYNYYTNSKLQY